MIEPGGIMWKKLIIPILLVSGLVISCAPMKQAGQPSKPEKLELTPANTDSLEYELIIIDAGFQPWLDMHRKPIWYYSNDYLAAMNYQYVIAWNEKARDPFLLQNRADSPFMMEIDYRPTIDYGIELNYKLYHYFKFVEATWGKILPYERHN